MNIAITIRSGAVNKYGQITLVTLAKLWLAMGVGKLLRLLKWFGVRYCYLFAQGERNSDPHKPSVAMQMYVRLWDPSAPTVYIPEDENPISKKQKREFSRKKAAVEKYWVLYLAFPFWLFPPAVKKPEKEVAPLGYESGGFEGESNVYYLPRR